MKRMTMMLIGILFLFTSQQSTAQEVISYSGSSTIGTGVLAAGALTAFTEKTGIKVASVQEPGSGKGVQALIAGMA